MICGTSASLTPKASSRGGLGEYRQRGGRHLAARKSRTAVSMDDFKTKPSSRGALGLERKSRIMTPEDKLRVAFHEGGHALVACALPNTSPVHKITIIQARRRR